MDETQQAEAAQREGETPQAEPQARYLGVDVGGTKIMAALVERSGNILARKRGATPRDGSAEDALAAILQIMDDLLAEEHVGPQELTAIGLVIPGVVDPDAGRVVVTPNMNLTGLEIVPQVSERFGVPVALGNDVNMGTLGEKWLGAAQRAQSAVGIFVGTGIGGGLIIDGKLVRGCREGAAEVGHIVMQVGGPLCGCGNRGCLEAIASRSAMERDIRHALASGRKSIVPELLDDPDAPIKSGVLKRALKAHDPLVTEVVRQAAQYLGYACLTVRHLIDPDVIILGGGVMEACGKFIMPIVQDIVASDALAGARPGSYIARSELGDDAVVLGAVALAQELANENPLETASQTVPDYPTITYAGLGEVAIDNQVHQTDLYIRADGKIKKRSKKLAKTIYGTAHKIGPEELQKVCNGHPRLVVVGTGHSGMAALTPEAEQFLRNRHIAFEQLPNPGAVEAYNQATGRKAFIIHVKC